MLKIQNQKHTKEILPFFISRLLERASYFGIRAILIFYLIDKSFEMEDKKAFEIIGLLSLSMILSQIIGALVGDLLIGNKKAIIIGGLLQAVGTFVFCMPSLTALYWGIAILALGSGLYTPNLISNFGKLYLNKDKLLDSAFTLLYLIVNLGASLGTFVIGYISEIYSYQLGFIICGILMLLSMIPIFISKVQVLPIYENKIYSLRSRSTKILVAFALVAIFWLVYEICIFQQMELQLQFKQLGAFTVPSSFWLAGSSSFYLPFAIIAVVLWSFYYSSQFFKLMLGFLFAAVAFGIMLLIPQEASENYAFIFIIALFFLSIAEIYLAPIIYSVLTKYTNPKYLAIFISLAFIPTSLTSLVMMFFGEDIVSNPSLALTFGFLAMCILGIALLIFLSWNKNKANN